MAKRERRARPLLRLAFGAIVVLLVCSQLAAYVQGREVRASINRLESTAQTSIRLVQRMGLDIQRQRILYDRHIFEHDAARMQEVEARITTIAEDFATAARDYSPLATFAGEANVWRRLTLDAAAVEQRTARALELSRRNADVEAAAAMFAAEPSYDAVDRDVDALVALNQAEVDRAHAEVEELRDSVARLRFVLAAVTLLLTVLVGKWVTRAIRRREAEIEHHTLALENRNRELDAFAGRVAHDLRGPLNTIKLSGSLLAEQSPDDQRTAAILRRGVAQMEQLIADLLTLSRIDGRALGMIARTDSVASIIQEELGGRVKDVGGTLHIDVRPARVRCSEGLLRQVLWNLGENAVKYRRADAPLSLEMTGRASAGHYELRVSDNGSGMSPDEAHAAFEPFFRGTQTKSIPGTGLGLSIVRRIVEASGGEISLDSAAGRGTTISISLLLGDQPTATSAAVASMT